MLEGQLRQRKSCWRVEEVFSWREAVARRYAHVNEEKWDEEMSHRHGKVLGVQQGFSLITA